MIIEELVTIFGFETRGEGNIERLNQQLDIGRRRLTLFQSALAGFAGGVAAGVFISLTRAVTDFIKSIPAGAVRAGSTFENLEVRLRSLTGSAAEAQKAMAWIREFAINTPLELEDVTEGFARLKAYGLDPMNGTMQAIVDQSSQLGGSQERLQGIILAVGQAWAKQKLQGQEILQLINQGVPVWEMLEEVTGKSGEALAKMAQDGALGRQEIQKLIELMGRRSAGAAQAFSKTWTGILSNISDEWTSFLKDVADAGFFEIVKEQAADLLETFREMRRDGSLQVLARDISTFLTFSVEGARRAIESFVNVGNLFLTTAQGINEALEQFTGVSGIGMIGAVAGGAGALGGRRLLLWLAARIPIVAVFLVLEDLAKYLKGEGKSVIGEAMVAIEEASQPGGQLEHTAAAIDDITEAWKGLLEVFGFDREWSLVTALKEAVEQLDLMENTLREISTILETVERIMRWLRSGSYDDPDRQPGGATGGGGWGGEGAVPPPGDSGGAGPLGQLYDAVPEVLKLDGAAPRQTGNIGDQGPLPRDRSDRAQRMMNRLIAKGWTPEAAASVVGQAQAESGFNPTASGDRGTAHGLFQWRHDRFEALKHFAAQRGKSWQDFDTQVDFFDEERKRRSKSERDWHNVTDVDVGNRIGKMFERYAGGLQHGRATAGRQALAEWQRRGGMAQLAEARLAAEAPVLDAAAGQGDLGAVASSFTEGDRTGGNITMSAPVTINNPKGEVVPKKVEEAIGHAFDRVRAAQRASDVAVQRPVPDGPALGSMGTP